MEKVSSCYSAAELIPLDFENFHIRNGLRRAVSSTLLYTLLISKFTQRASSFSPCRCSPVYVCGSTPCAGPFCSADPVVGVVHWAWEGEERSVSAAAEWANRGRDIRLSSETITHRSVTFTALSKFCLLREVNSSSSSSSALVWSIRAAACRKKQKTPKRGGFSWHELTYELDMETKPFLSLGKFVCLMTLHRFNMNAVVLWSHLSPYISVQRVFALRLFVFFWYFFAPFSVFWQRVERVAKMHLHVWGCWRGGAAVAVQNFTSDADL